MISVTLKMGQGHWYHSQRKILHANGKNVDLMVTNIAYRQTQSRTQTQTIGRNQAIVIAKPMFRAKKTL